MPSLNDFIDANANADPAKLMLKYRGVDLGFSLDFAVEQIAARQKFGAKLAETLGRHPNFVFPSILAGEQATSDLFARFHASLVPDGASVCDLTAGLGIDLFHLYGKVLNAIAVELDSQRVKVLQHNALTLARNAIIVEADCREFIADYKGDAFDIIFIDPARRAADGRRVFALEQCEPDVIAMMPDIQRNTKRLIVKMSPMLDITKTYEDLRAAISGECVIEMIALGTPNECRELVAVIDFHKPSSFLIKAVTLRDGSRYPSFEFTLNDEADALATYGMPEPGNFLVEPYAAVMKTAPWRLFAQRFGLKAAAPNSHVYFADAKREDIPAAQLQIIDVIPYSSSNIKRLHKTYPKAMVACRNFDIPAAALRAKLKVGEGDDIRILATKDADEKPWLIVAQTSRRG